MVRIGRIGGQPPIDCGPRSVEFHTQHISAAVRVRQTIRLNKADLLATVGAPVWLRLGAGSGGEMKIIDRRADVLLTFALASDAGEESDLGEQ